MARQGYGKLSNGFHSNTKVLKLQRMRPSALGVYCMAISFCSDVLNDGVMSEDDVIYQLNATEEDIEALIKVGMFERSDDGSYRIHDYLSHQSSRERRRGLSHRVRAVLADLSTQDRQTQGLRGLAEGAEENQQHVPDRQGVEVRRRPEPGTRLHAHPGELAGRRTLGR